MIPALAIGRELRDSHGAEVRFLGTQRGLETRLVPEAGFPLETIRVGQLNNVSLLTRVKTLGDLPRGIFRCVALLRTYRPNVVVGVGGYASGPAMLAAAMLRIPTLAFEPNAVPGLANRLVGRMVSAAAVNFSDTATYFRNAHVTGIPVRPEFFEVPIEPPAGLRRLLVLGGSQGAQALNQTVPQIAKRLLHTFPDLTIVHQAGQRHCETTRQAYMTANVDPDRVEVVPFLNAIESIAAASLLVGRSGASTVAELCAAGRPAIFVPFPQAADDHQTRNAQAIARAGAAELLPQSELTPERLLAAVEDLLSNPSRLREMRERSRSLARPEALHEIAALAVAVAK